MIGATDRLTLPDRAPVARQQPWPVNGIDQPYCRSPNCTATGIRTSAVHPARLGRESAAPGHADRKTAEQFRIASIYPDRKGKTHRPVNCPLFRQSAC